MNIPFSPPRIDEKIIESVREALYSGWITTGPKTKLFEKKITAYTGGKTTLCLNSATAGLELMLRWFGIKEGDEVIIPAYTYCATANVVIHCGAKPVMVDVDANFNIAVQKVKESITPRTKVIMPVDFSGFPCDYNELNKLVKQPEIASQFVAETEEQQKLGRILILSDSAHSFGANYDGKKVGQVTDVSVFSFHAVKNLSTAEGGAVVLNFPAPFDNEEIYKYLSIRSLHGQNKDAMAKFQKGSWKYDVIDAGYKCNMTDIQAAIGLIEIDRYDQETLPKRKAIFDRYSKAFSMYDWAEIPLYETQHKTSSYHVYPLRIKNINEEQRNELIQLISETGVSVNVHFQPLPMLSYYKTLGYCIKDYPVAYDNYAREISLPVYFNLTDEQIEYIIQSVSNTMRKTIK